MKWLTFFIWVLIFSSFRRYLPGFFPILTKQTAIYYEKSFLLSFFIPPLPQFFLLLLDKTISFVYVLPLLIFLPSRFFFLEERLKTIALFLRKRMFIRVVIVKIQ